MIVLVQSVKCRPLLSKILSLHKFLYLGVLSRSLFLFNSFPFVFSYGPEKGIGSSV